MRSKKKNKEFTPDEIMRLQAFGIRDPDIYRALNDVCDLLQSKALPQIEECYSQAIRDLVSNAIKRSQWDKTNPYPKSHHRESKAYELKTEG